MRTRIDLHNTLLTFCDTVYFQPPAGHRLKYPCILYHRLDNEIFYANDKPYHKIVNYQVTVIDSDPDSAIADQIENDIIYAKITNRYTRDNLYHTILNLKL